MTELTTTRSNAMVDPLLHVWGWEIPVYLFLGGMVAGMMAISGYFLFSGRYKHSRCACFVLPGLSVVLLSIGMLALFLDLEHKLFVWRLYTTFEVLSPMSWGAWILILVYPGLLANFVLRLPPPLESRLPALKRLSDRLLERAQLVRTIGVVNMVLGGLLGIYTGILLSALGARPLWDSALLGPIFLLSGLSAAAAFVHMIARDPEESEMLAKADNAFLAGELAAIVLYIVGLITSTRVHQEAAGLFLGGPFTAMFWVFVVGLGICVPLVVQLFMIRAGAHGARHTFVAPLLVLAGGVVLRFVIVNAGQFHTWSPI